MRVTEINNANMAMLSGLVVMECKQWIIQKQRNEKCQTHQKNIRNPTDCKSNQFG